MSAGIDVSGSLSYRQMALSVTGAIRTLGYEGREAYSSARRKLVGGCLPDGRRRAAVHTASVP